MPSDIQTGFVQGNRVLLLSHGIGADESATVVRLEGFCEECGSKAYLVETDAKQRIIMCRSAIASTD